jgi:hypothetical protein
MNVSLSDNAEAMRADMKTQAAEMLEAAGATEVEAYEQRYWPGEGIHEMGGARGWAGIRTPLCSTSTTRPMTCRICL